MHKEYINYSVQFDGRSLRGFEVIELSFVSFVDHNED